MAPETQTQDELSDTKNRTTDLLAGGRGAYKTRNDKFNFHGHKSSDRKTGIAQADNHSSWKQVYYLCSVDVCAHEGERGSR